MSWVIFILALTLLGVFYFRIHVPLKKLLRAIKTRSFNDIEMDFEVNRSDVVGSIARSIREVQLQLSHESDLFLKEKQTLENILMHLKDGVLAVDDGGNIRFCNPAAKVILGIEKPNVLGKSVEEVIPSAALIDFAKKHQEPNVEKELLIFRSGLPRHIWVQMQTQVQDHTKTLFIQDVTERKRLETLRQEFVANASHELKTPLAVMQGYAALILEGHVQGEVEQKKMIEKIFTQTQRLSELTKNLLLLSKVESGQFILNPKTFDPSAEIQKTLDDLEPLAQKKEIQLVADLPQTQVWNSHPEAFREITFNLIENALKYSEAKSTVLIKLFFKDPAWVLEVKDQGVGIAEYEMPKIFERFYRTEKSRTTEGTGLGLSIVKHLASELGAHIEVDSVVGQGSTFRVIFHFS